VVTAKRKTVEAVGSSQVCIDKAKGSKGAENEGVRRQVSQYLLKGISWNVEYEDGLGISKGESWLSGNGCLKVAVYSGNSSCPKEDSSFVEKVRVDKLQNSIMIYHKSNSNFKSHINFC
jgi:hypothetical protein